MPSLSLALALDVKASTDAMVSKVLIIFLLFRLPRFSSTRPNLTNAGKIR